MRWWHWLGFLLVLVLLLVDAAEGKKKKKKDKDGKDKKKKRKTDERFCGVCIAIMMQAEDMVQRVGSKTWLTVGGPRWDRNGREYQKKIPYARSETHVLDVVENVCDWVVKNWTVTDSGGGIPMFVRKPPGLKRRSNLTEEDLRKEEEMVNEVQLTCENVLGMVENKLQRMLMEEEDEIARRICVKKKKWCKKSDLTSQKIAQSAMDQGAEQERLGIKPPGMNDTNTTEASGSKEDGQPALEGAKAEQRQKEDQDASAAEKEEEENEKEEEEESADDSTEDRNETPKRKPVDEL